MVVGVAAAALDPDAAALPALELADAAGAPFEALDDAQPRASASTGARSATGDHRVGSSGSIMALTEGRL